MPALNFESWKAPLVESGASRQTIRLERKRPIKPGQMLYFFVGQRTKKCHRLGKDICTSVQPIKIGEWAILIDGKQTVFVEWMELVLADGFTGGSFLEDFFDFFRQRYGLPFVGVLIKW